ncbi:hypothetical protein Agub_g13883, partial [Astrephomene gubernaculifera]
AGLLPALLSCLSRPPSQLRYWQAINLGVVGARLLEMQWWLLVVARTCLLPQKASEEAQQQQQQQQQPAAATPAAPAESQSQAKEGRLLEAAAQAVLQSPALRTWVAQVTAAAAEVAG